MRYLRLSRADHQYWFFRWVLLCHISVSIDRDFSTVCYSLHEIEISRGFSVGSIKAQRIWCVKLEDIFCQYLTDAQVPAQSIIEPSTFSKIKVLKQQHRKASSRNKVCHFSLKMQINISLLNTLVYAVHAFVTWWYYIRAKKCATGSVSTWDNVRRIFWINLKGCLYVYTISRWRQ